MAHGDHDPKVLEQKKIDSQFLGLPASKTKFAMDLWVMEGKLITRYFCHLVQFYSVDNENKSRSRSMVYRSMKTGVLF